MLYNFVEYLLKYTINAEIISSVFIDRCDLVRSAGVWIPRWILQIYGLLLLFEAEPLTVDENDFGQGANHDQKFHMYSDIQLTADGGRE